MTTLFIKPDMNQNQIDYQFNYGMTLTFSILIYINKLKTEQLRIMKIALFLGYGKMGKVIERIALERGHQKKKS